MNDVEEEADDYDDDDHPLHAHIHLLMLMASLLHHHYSAPSPEILSQKEWNRQKADSGETRRRPLAPLTLTRFDDKM